MDYQIVQPPLKNVHFTPSTSRKRARPADIMPSAVWVKVVGFSDAERHSIRTMFRLSAADSVQYLLWTPENAALPNVTLIDADCYEGGMDVASPSFNPNMHVISVGAGNVPNAWRRLSRPLDWSKMVGTLDALFAHKEEHEGDTQPGFSESTFHAPGRKRALVVGLEQVERLYLQARLSLAGVTDVDAVSTVDEAIRQFSRLRYDIVMICLELETSDAWELVAALHDLPTPVKSVIVMTHSPSWKAIQKAESMNCLGLLEIPFIPRDVLGLLQKV